MKRTIYDVASEAGVAISTVSRVLNGSSEVSDATRERVLAAIEKLQFRPQRTARTLAQQETHSLAVAMPSFTSLFYVELLKGIKDELRDRDIDLLLCNLGSTSPYDTLLRFLNRGAVDALLLASLPIDEKLERELGKLHAPVMIVGYETDAFDSLYWDDVEGARLAVEHLAKQGHSRIGFIAAQPWSYVADRRLEGYRQGLEGAGIDFDPSLVVTGKTSKHAGFSEEAGYEAMQDLLERDNAITAVCASSDVQAYGAWAALRDAARVVPDDVALVGYDNLKLSRFLGLTTIDQRMYQVGRSAAQSLLNRIEGTSEALLSGPVSLNLIVRSSSDPDAPALDSLPHG